MKKIILTFFLSLSVVVPSFAQNNVGAMRFLMVNALIKYGQQLYDRGDFYGAMGVFNHVLAYDRHQEQALEYLKKMGYAPAHPVKNIVVVKKTDEQVVGSVDVLDTESLKKAIAAQKQVVEKLRNQIKQLKENLVDDSGFPTETFGNDMIR